MSTISEKSLGILIKKAIDESGIKQSVIAKRMNVSRQTINQIDRRKTFDLQFLQELKKASGLDFTEYVFNPGRRGYQAPNIGELKVLEEPAGDLRRKPLIDFSLTVKIRAEKEYITKVSDLLMAFRTEADKLGFSIQ